MQGESMARGGAGAYLLLAIGLATVLLLIVLVGERPLPIGGNILSDLQLTEEVLPPQTLYATTLNLEPGQVYQITYDANGLSLVQRGTQLIERINLTGNIAVNDVIAPSIYEWYFDGVDDYIDFNYNTNTLQAAAFMAKVKNLAVPSTSDKWGDLISIYIGFRFEWNPIRRNYFTLVTLKNTTTGDYITLDSFSNSLDIGDMGWIAASVYVNTTSGYWHRVGWLNGTTTADRDMVYKPAEYDSIFKMFSIRLGKDINGYASGNLGSAIIWLNTVIRPEIFHAIYQTHSIDNPKPSMIIDATFFNGTTYYDLINGTNGIPYGGVARVPAEEPFLWLVKSLESDNRLHLRYVPAGSLFRVKFNNMVYEWRVPGDCANAVGLCEDFPVDIAGVVGQTVLPNATVELVYPSAKVRFYVPSGFRVVVEDAGWSETHDVPLNTGFVDFTLPRDGAYTVRVLGYEEEPRVQVQTSGDTARVIVTDRSGYALAGAKVWVYDGGNLAAAGATNDMGVYEFDKSQISGDQARIVVTHLSNGKYYTSDKLVNLSASSPTITVQHPVDQVASAANNSGSTGTIVLVLLLGMVIVLLLLRSNRRAHVLVMLLAFGAMAATVHADTQAPLAWRDTGFDLAPGYRHTISMHVTYTNFPFYHRAGEASVQAGPLRAELVSDMDLLWGFTYRFNIYVHGDRVYDEDIDAGFVGRNSVDRVVQVEVDCNGNAIVYVDGQQVGGFTINGNIDILKNEVDGAEVRVTGSRLYSCSSSGTQPGTGTVPPNPPPADSELLNSIGRAMGTAALAAFAALLLGGVALLLLAGYRQARKRRLV